MKNKIEDLRDHLFATLEGLRDKEAPMDIERAKAVSQVAQTIIESAKVECKYVELMGGKGIGFMGDTALPSSKPSERPRLANGKAHS